MVTPLQPREFFRGIWKGEGELIPNPLLRWLIPREHITFVSKPVWLSENVWIVKERFEFSSGDVMARTMFIEVTGSERLHVTADDMPLGADIILQEKGFYFTSYLIWPHYKGRRWHLQCIDENLIDDNGTINDTIKMFFRGFPVATMHLVIRRDRTESLQSK